LACSAKRGWSSKAIGYDGFPSSRFEEEAASLGALRIAGTDEAGRGPLAGPVVAAAVILPYSDPIPGLNDSKLLPASKRETLFDLIMERAVSVGLGVIQPETIDRINILQATRLAMTTAVNNLTPPPDYLLIDGPISLDLNICQRPIIKGDQLSVSIAAAGILAKVSRDRLMQELHEQYPQYGFDTNKGYGTRAHKLALCRYGPSPLHRKSFQGGRGLLPEL
jgi:ribonuclease HII